MISKPFRIVYHCGPDALSYILIVFVFVSQPKRILYIVQNYYTVSCMALNVATPASFRENRRQLPNSGPLTPRMSYLAMCIG